MEFRYKGREILIHTRKIRDGHWDWSFFIRGHGQRQNSGELAPSEGIAIDEAYVAARKEIDQISEDWND